MTVVELLQLARARGVMIATAESCTGGLLAGRLTDIPGSSDMFERGFVTYSNQAKAEMLGVDTDLIREHGAVSQQVASAMAQGAIARSAATLAVSITGVAGPGGSAAKPEGMVCFGLAFGESLRAETVQFGALGRSAVREKSVQHGLALLASALQ